MSDPLGLVSQVGGASPVRPVSPVRPPDPHGNGQASFKDVLMKNIDEVNKLQQDAETAIEDLVSGRRDDVDGVLIAKQKADLAFQMLLQVRNKMTSAYEEIKQMRV